VTVGSRDGWFTVRRYRIVVALSVVASVLLRLRFLFTPLSPDEGGFLAIARSWAHGRQLYRDVWVDRPQGLLLLFRLWDRLAFGNPKSVRVMAMVFGAALVIASAEIGRRLYSLRAGALAAAFVAAASSAAAIEGFLANGELLSGALSAITIAVAAAVVTRRASLRGLGWAGASAAVAVSIKQSGVDGFLAVLAWLLVAMALGVDEGRRRYLVGMAWLIGGFAAAALPFVIHASLTDWSDWWYAIAGYRLDSRSAVAGSDWARFWSTWRDVTIVFVPMVAAAVVALAAGGRSSGRDGTRRTWSPRWIVPLWIAMATLAFVSGGQFFHHYWVVLAAPVGVAAAVAIATIDRSVFTAVFAAAAVVPVIGSTLSIARLPREQVPIRISGFPRSIKEERIASWFEHVRQPGDTIYVLCAGASVYALANADPPFPYLWLPTAAQFPGASQRLTALLTSPDGAPTYVADLQGEADCGLAAGTLRQQYRPLTTVEGTVIWQLAATD
jgi:hypothetical protein